MDDEELREKVARLRAAGFGKAGRRSVVDRTDAIQGALEAELRAEMAASLGRAAHKVEVALVALEEAGRTGDPGGWDEARRAALRAKWELQVHREALGLYRHDDLDRLYPIPARPRKA